MEPFSPHIVVEGCDIPLVGEMTPNGRRRFAIVRPWFAGPRYASESPASMVVHRGAIWQCARTHAGATKFDESDWIALARAQRLTVFGAPAASTTAAGATWRLVGDALLVDWAEGWSEDVRLEAPTMPDLTALLAEPARSGRAFLVADPRSLTPPSLYVAAFEEAGAASGAEGIWRWRPYDAALPSAMQWGLAGDGIADDSVAAKAFIDAHKGRTVLFDVGRRFLLGGVTLEGRQYDGTRLVFEGEAVVKAAPSRGAGNFQNACWTGIAFQECDSCAIEGNFHGNRDAQPDSEHIYCVTLAGVTRFDIPTMRVREIRGDGLYVSQARLTAASANSDGLAIGSIEGVNSADDGRNLVSIISCDNVRIQTLKSMRIGGVINGVREPGGFDIEPDHDFQSCKNIVVNAVDVVTAGFSGLAILGRRSANVTRNVRIGSADVVNTSHAETLDAIGELTMTRTHTLAIIDAGGVTIDSFSGAFLHAYGDAIVISNSDTVSIVGKVSHVREGARIGNDAYDNGADATGVVNSHIDLRVSDVARFGFRAGRVTKTTVIGKVVTPVAGYYPGGVFAMLTTGGFLQQNVTYSVDVPYSPDWDRAYRNDVSFPCTFANSRIANVRFGDGWSDYLTMKDMAVLIDNAHGYTDSIKGKPTNGPHVVGQYIHNRLSGPDQPKGWRCIASGTPGLWVEER